ncbi:hypothetical protein AYI68_g5564 [Smittium mucronatum]|uniref:Uncharacterized protein n=1 Tax=Smittium mucronatum TaxID=133383 RepID=A0A1R0GTX5_9FUNG|nr:hypothetical protein AYI68_g5564 [Smittium mucronatum]
MGKERTLSPFFPKKKATGKSSGLQNSWPRSSICFLLHSITSRFISEHIVNFWPHVGGLRKQLTYAYSKSAHSSFDIFSASDLVQRRLIPFSTLMLAAGSVVPEVSGFGVVSFISLMYSSTTFVIFLQLLLCLFSRLFWFKNPSLKKTTVWRTV